MKITLVGACGLADGYLGAANALRRLGYDFSFIPAHHRRNEDPQNHYKKIAEEINEFAADAVLWWHSETLTAEQLTWIRNEVSGLFFLYSWDALHLWETKHGGLDRQEKCPLLDIAASCCIQSVELYKKYGAKRVVYIPPGFEPSVHYPDNDSKFSCDLSMVLTNFYHGDAWSDCPHISRYELWKDIKRLLPEIKIKLYGTSNIGEEFPEDWNGFISFDQSRKVFSNSKINICTHLRPDARGYYSERLPQILGSGGLLLVDNVAGLSEIIKNEEECVIIDYSSPEALAKQIRELLADDARRERIKKAGMKKALSSMTWDHWAEIMHKNIHEIIQDYSMGSNTVRGFHRINRVNLNTGQYWDDRFLGETIKGGTSACDDIIAWIKLQNKLTNTSTVIDIGSGPNKSDSFLNKIYEIYQCECIAVDISQQIIQSWDKTHITGKLAKIPDLFSIATNSADLLLASHVLEHVEDLTLAISEIARIIKPGGIIIVNAPIGKQWQQEQEHIWWLDKNVDLGLGNILTTFKGNQHESLIQIYQSKKQFKRTDNLGFKLGSMQEKVTIYVYFYEGELLTRETINSIETYTPKETYNLVLIDDGSPSNVGEKFKNEGYDVIFHGINRGIAASINTCLKHPDKIKFIMQNDIWVSENWLPPLLEVYKAYPEFAYISPYAVENYGAEPPFNGTLEDFNNKVKPLRQYFSQLSFPRYWGGAWLCNASFLDRVGEYDETFKYYADDMDIIYRMRQKGIPTVSIGSSLVFHHGNSTMKNHFFTKYLPEQVKALQEKWKDNIPPESATATISRFKYNPPFIDKNWMFGMSLRADKWLMVDKPPVPE